MAESRRKGAAGEREVASLLFAELGMKFSRDLRQYQRSDLGDLVCEDEDFPFVIEVKRYAAGWTCKPAWEVQAFRSAQEAQKHPCVIYRYDGQKWRARVWIDAISEAIGSPVVAGFSADLDIHGFCWIARELMARRVAA